MTDTTPKTKAFRVSVPVETTYYIEVKASSKRQALAWARQQRHLDIWDQDPPDYDWDAAKADVMDEDLAELVGNEARCVRKSTGA